MLLSNAILLIIICLVTIKLIIVKRMNLPALQGGVSCLRYKLDEVRSVRKLFNCGVYYHDF